MRVQAGQILLHGLEVIVKLLQAAVVLILIGIIAVAPAGPVAPIAAADPVPVVPRLRADAVAVGLIPPPAPVNNLHHKVAIMYRHQVVQADGILILRLVLAARVQPAVDPLPVADLLQVVPPAVLVLQVIIG